MQRDLPEHEIIGGDIVAPDTEPGAGTELWFARRIAREHGDSLKYVWAWRCWIAWQPDQGRWARDDGAAAWSAAKTSVKRLLSEASSVAGGDEARAKFLLKAAHRFMARSSLESALKLAMSEAAVIATVGEWDSHPHLLNCVNGTVDLRDGKLHSHRREDRLTKTTSVAYQPDARSSVLDSFLARILPQPELREYVQAAIGYSAIGEVTEHLLHVVYGSGANGKSVLFGAAANALGEYSISVPTALLMDMRGSQHPTILTTLRGARLALASETPEGGRFNEAQLKMLTGGDAITARGMRENFYEFQPSHTLWIATNHKPRAKETTLAFWRRMRLVPFTVTIPAEQQDKRLPQKLKDDCAAVLAWVVAGAVRYFRDGLEPPAIVADATAQYQADEDEMREFVELYQPGGFTTCKAVHEHFVAWADASGIKPVGQRTLTRTLQERGWEYLQHHRPRGFRACTVPKGKTELNSGNDFRVGLIPKNTLPNGAAPATPQVNGTCDDTRNGADDVGDQVDRWMEDTQ